MLLVFSTTNFLCNFPSWKVFFLSFVRFSFLEFLLCLSLSILPYTFFQTIQSSPFSYAVIHTYKSFFLHHVQSCHTNSWMQTSVQCHYLSSFPIYILNSPFVQSRIPPLYLITPIAQAFMLEIKFLAFRFDFQINFTLLMY